VKRSRVQTLLALRGAQAFKHMTTTRQQNKRVHIFRALWMRHRIRSIRRISPRDWISRWPGWMPF